MTSIADAPRPSDDGRPLALWLPLSHHYRDDAYRCLHLPVGRRRLAVCARCLALYPTMTLAIGLQLALRLGPVGAIDWWVALVGAAPGLFDWGIGRLGHRGTNAVRMVTGSLLGLALGRSFVLYFQDPANEIFWVQLALLAFGAVAFELVRRLRL